MRSVRAVLAAALLIVLAGTLLASTEKSLETTSRRVALSYAVEVGPFEAGAGPVDLFLPYPVEDAQQRVVAFSVRDGVEGIVEQEDAYGNRFWRAHWAEAPTEVQRITLDFEIERRVDQNAAPAGSRPLSNDEREAHARFLAANERVAVSDPILAPILDEVRAEAGSKDKSAIARAIFDWVVDNVEYKKVGTGWGNGDTFWACSERYGNCTDFHSLFISLARTEGIPARFEMGFPLPDERASGTIGGYHCWVEFYLPEVGWIPIDASEAFKQPDKRELFYGTHPTDRVHFSTGRDLRLGEAHRGRPLNYFVYPYVEVGGRAWAGPVERQISYRDL